MFALIALSSGIMNRTLLILLLSLLGGCSAAADQNRALPVPLDDADMNAAIAEARRTLPEFFAALDMPAGGASGLALKVELSDPNGTEYVWLNRITREEGKLFGTVNNEPNTIRSVKHGEKIEVDQKIIADWLYMRNGKMHGNFTLRPLLSRIPKEQADNLKGKLPETAEAPATAQ